jgi:hypothetical protein
MSPLFLNYFFILVQYIILKLNVSSHPPVYEKIQKSLYGTVRFTVPAAWWLSVVRMRTYEVARELAAETEHAEHCLFRSADLDVLVEGSFLLLRVCCAY